MAVRKHARFAIKIREPSKVQKPPLHAASNALKAPNPPTRLHEDPHFSNSLAEKGRTHAKTHRRGVRRAVKLGPVVLVFRAICPSPACRRRGWPCPGYSGLVNPGSGLLVCWSEPQTRKCRQSLGRLLGRAAVIRAEYERIERIGSSQRGDTYIHRRGKIKAKPASISNS